MTERNETKGQAPLAPMRHFSVGRLAAAALALVILLAIFSVVVVESGQVGVVVRTGAESPSRVLTEPGIYGRIPFVERVWVLDTRWQSAEQSTLQSYVTQDQQSLQLAGWVVWRVADPQRFSMGTASGKNGIEERVFGALGKSLSPLISETTAATIAAGLSTSQLSQWLDALNTQLEPLGVEAAHVGIRQVAFPDAFNEAVYQRMAGARQQAEQQLIQGVAADEQQLVALQTQQRDTVLQKAYALAQQQRQAAETRLVNAYAKQYGQAAEFRNRLNGSAPATAAAPSTDSASPQAMTENP